MKLRKIDLHELQSFQKRQSKKLEMLMQIHQSIKENKLPILYFAGLNSAVIVNFDEYTKQMALLELYQSLCKDYPQKIWHKEFDKIKKLEEELDE